jgi:tetratricopeptide (TPR) repeat protein
MIKYILTLTCFILFTGVINAQFSDEVSYKEVQLVQEVKDAYADQNFALAQQRLAPCLASDNLKSEGYFYMIKGDVEFALKQFEEAKSSYIKSVQLSKPADFYIPRSNVGIERANARLEYEQETEALKKAKKAKDSISSQPNYTTQDMLVKFEMVERVPIYPGCEKKSTNTAYKKCMQAAINKFVSSKLRTSIASIAGLQGRVQILTRFKVDKNGEVINVEAVSSNPLLEKEAIRVINLFPTMQPGEQKGKPVGVIYGLPLIFDVR